MKERIQARIDELYDVFVSTVARNRGIEEKAVRRTEALTFTASQSLSNGLADEIGALDDATAAFAAELFPDEGDDEMSNQDKAAEKAALDAARAEGRTEGEKAGREAGHKEGASAMQERCKAILSSEEAKGREGMANHLAFSTDMDAAAAVGLMKEAPKATAGGPPNRFEQTMNQTPNPTVGAELGGEGDPNDVEAIFQSAGYAPRRAA